MNIKCRIIFLLIKFFAIFRNFVKILVCLLLLLHSRLDCRFRLQLAWLTATGFFGLLNICLNNLCFKCLLGGNFTSFFFLFLVGLASYLLSLLYVVQVFFNLLLFHLPFELGSVLYRHFSSESLFSSLICLLLLLLISCFLLGLSDFQL